MRSRSSRAGITFITKSVAPPHSRNVPKTEPSGRWGISPPENRIRCVGGDTGPLERRGVAPHGVVVPGPQHHGAVRHGSVQPAGIEQSALGQAAS